MLFVLFNLTINDIEGISPNISTKRAPQRVSDVCIRSCLRRDAVQHITDSGEVISCDVSAVHEFPEPYVDHAVFVECYNRF